MKRTTLSLVIFGIFCSCAWANAQESGKGNEALLFRSLGYGIWTTQIADIVSTEMFLRNGWDETNGLWKNDNRRRYIAYPLKIGFAWALNEATERLYNRSPVVATLIRAGIVAGYSALVANNLKLSMSVRF